MEAKGEEAPLRFTLKIGSPADPPDPIRERVAARGEVLDAEAVPGADL